MFRSENKKNIYPCTFWFYWCNGVYVLRTCHPYLSCLMRKPTICICKNKDADQLRGNCKAAKLISAFVFATRIVHFLFFLNPKFQASSLLLWLYSLICVGHVRKPHCWFSHETAHLYNAAEERIAAQYVLEVELWIKSVRPRMMLKTCTLLLLLIAAQWLS